LIHFKKRVAMSQARREVCRAHNISEEDAQKMVADATLFFLTADQKKSVIKRPELVKLCDLGRKPKQLQDYIIGQATLALSDTFGIEVKDLSKSSQYVLINKLAEDNGQFLKWSEKENAQMGLIFIILGLILMSNGKVTDELLFKFLKSLGLYEDEKPGKSKPVIDADVNETFDNDIKKFINDVLVTKQHYLKRERVQTADAEAEVYEYSWGERAENEVKESSVFKMVCDVFECEGKMFQEEWERIKNKEGLGDDFCTRGEAN